MNRQGLPHAPWWFTPNDLDAAQLVQATGPEHRELDAQAVSSPEPAPSRPALLLRARTKGHPQVSIAYGLQFAGAGYEWRIVEADYPGPLCQRVWNRAAAEFCAATLPPVDYSVALRNRAPGADLNHFNLAMQRAGERRSAMLAATRSLSGVEARTAISLIGRLEDYDLAHFDTGRFVRQVKNAWRARQRYPWCRDAPLEVFERFVAQPRIEFEEVECWTSQQARLLPRVVQSARTTFAAADALCRWMAELRGEAQTSLPLPGRHLPDLLHSGCEAFSIAFAGLGRTVGLLVRVAYTFWPTNGNGHFWNEVWDTRYQRWHAFDASALDRPFDFPWLHRVAKSAILTSSGERGGWNALAEERFEALTNTVALFYPSGEVLVRVLQASRSLAGQRVLAQVWLGEGMGGSANNAKKFWKPEVFLVAAAVSDSDGFARLRLGQSVWRPYRIALEGPGQSDWGWVAVLSNRLHTLDLDRDVARRFGVRQTPPTLEPTLDSTASPHSGGPGS